MSNCRVPAILITVTILCSLLVSGALAQGDWSATLIIDPYPSPYISDWENNPSIGSATLYNNSDQDVRVRILASITRLGHGVAGRAESIWFDFPPGSFQDIASTELIDFGTIDYDKSIEEIAIRTGRLPEGEYELCITVEDESGTVLIDNVCAGFTLVYPDPPSLILPSDEDTLITAYPVFQWLPVQVPPQFPVHYVLRIAEMEPNQVASQALESNILHYENTDLIATNLAYPADAREFRYGAHYAWQVQALDDNDAPPTSNSGESELWTFVYAPDTTTPQIPRVLAGHTYSARSGLLLDSVTVVYRPLTLKIEGEDTLWEAEDDSLVTVSDAEGVFSFAKAKDRSYFQLSAHCPDYDPVILRGPDYYQDADIRTIKLRLPVAPPGQNRLAGVVRDFFSNQPVAGASVVYHAVDPVESADDSGRVTLLYEDNQLKRLETITDTEGRFEFVQAAESSYFSLKAQLEPGYLPAEDIGTDQFQADNIDNYVMLLTPKASNITGTVDTWVSAQSKPVEGAIVQLRRVQETSQGARTTPGWLDLLADDSIEWETVSSELGEVVMTAYTDASGAFHFDRVPSSESQEQITIAERDGTTIILNKQITKGNTYGIVIVDDRYQEYTSETFTVGPGETIATGEHRIKSVAGSIAGIISSGGLPLSGAPVYLYPPVYRETKPDKDSRQSKSSHTEDGGSEWGNAGGKPDGDPLDNFITDDSGHYAFVDVPINDPLQTNDRYIVWVEPEGYNAEIKSARIEFKGQVDTVDFELSQSRGLVFGNLSDAGSRPLAHAQVTLATMTTVPGPGGSGDSLVVEASRRWVESDADGNYTLERIFPGQYRIIYEKSGYSSLTTEVFEITYGDRIRRNEILDAGSGTLALTVLKDTDAGLGDVSVKSPDMPSLVGFTDTNGNLMVTPMAADTILLQLRRLGYDDLDTTVFIPTNDTLELTVTMEKQVGKILVRVIEKGSGSDKDTLTSKRLQNMSVTLGDLEPRTSDHNGEVFFDDAPVGQFTLKVTVPESASNMPDYVPVEAKITVYEGLNVDPVTVAMAPAGRISGTVRDAESGAGLQDVRIVIDGYSAVTTTTGDNGAYTLRNVPANEKVALVARRTGYKATKSDEWELSAGDHIRNADLVLESSPLDSIFGFAVIVDSIKTPTTGNARVWGALIDIPPTFGLSMRDPLTILRFADVELDSAYRPVRDSIELEDEQVAVSVFGVKTSLYRDGGLLLAWVDSVQAGRIAGDVRIGDIFTKVFPGTDWTAFTIPQPRAPSFWTGGVNRGLEKYGLTADDEKVRCTFKSVSIALDYQKTSFDTAGFHFYGDIMADRLVKDTSIQVSFENLLIGKDESGDLAFKSIAITTDPSLSVALPSGKGGDPVVTLVADSIAWDNAIGFRAGGSIILNRLDNKTFSLRAHFSPDWDFLSTSISPNESGGTVSVYGQKLTVEKIELGTDNWDVDTVANVRYLSFTGALEITALDKPVELKNLKYSFNGVFTGTLGFNQSKTFAKIVTVMLEEIEFGQDEIRGGFVGVSGGIKFGAIKGLNVQASNLRFYYDGSVSVDEIGAGFVAGPTEVQIRMRWADGVFEGEGLLQVRPIFTAGAEFRYGGSQDWYVRIVAGVHIPMGPVELVEASGGIGRKDDTWQFMVGGVIAPARADKGISLDISVEVLKTPEGVIILGEADVLVASNLAVGRATIELNFPKERIMGSILLGYNFEALEMSAQVDLGVQFGKYWYIHGQAKVEFLGFLHADGVVVIANNWEWTHKGETRLIRGIYVELNSNYAIDGNWVVVKWGLYYNQYAMLSISWSGDFAGRINLDGGAWAWIGIDLGLFSIDLIEARGSFDIGAGIEKLGPEWSADAHARFRLVGILGSCSSGGCWSICWRCYVRIFGHCIFALPSGVKGCVTMNANVAYSTQKGIDVDVSF